MYPILTTLFLSILIFCAGGFLTFSLFIELFIGTIAVYAAGYSLATVAKINNLQCRQLVYLVTGAIISNLFTYFISSALHITAGLSFLYFSASVFLYILIFQSRKFFENILWNIDRHRFLGRSATDLLVFLCLMGYTLLWCWQISASFPTLVSKGVLTTWIDMYYHGAQIAQSSDIKSVGQGDIFLAGVSPFLYHRAMYMLSASIAQIANLSGLAAATALLLPMGFLFFAITIYYFCTQLAGRMSGVLAVIFLLVLPDNSWLGLHNGFLGFRYVLQVAPGTSYGLITCLLSLLFFAMWLREKSLNKILLSLFFGISVYFFRAHFFVLYFPVLMSSIFCAILFEKKYFWQLIGLLFTSVIILLCIFAAKNSAVIPFLNLVHLERGATFYTDFYKYIIDLNHPIVTIFTGITLLIGGILGIWMILYPLLLWKKTRKFGWEFIDFIPLILLICYIVLVLFAPALYQTFDELQHRPAGLLYTVIIMFSVIYGTRILNNQQQLNYIQPLFVLIVASGVFLTSLYSSNYPLRVLFRGYSLYQDYQIPLNHNIIESAIFLRQKAVPGEIFLTSKDDMDERNVDSAVVVSSIAGMPSYLGEQTVQSLRAEPARLAIIHYRDSVIRQSIVEAPTIKEAFKRMQDNHIAWFIALSYPKWDKLGKASVFTSDSMALYHVTG